MIRRMKGTYDVTSDIPYFHAIEKAMHSVSTLFQYKELRTPHFESSELFHRGVGETTDIVSKETYDFKDRGNRDNTLRPEGTAGIVRSYIENKLYANPVTPQKYYYYGSMFRYERPQKGRFREFRQFGAEAFGSLDAHMDAEVIAYAVTFLRALKLSDVTVHLNSLGGTDSKAAYHKALKDHLKDGIDTLCKDCQTRYDTNPLRILDCKVDQDNPLLTSAPKPLEYLTEDDTAHFDKVKRALKAMQIPFTVDESLVRGLDYYTHTVFELKVSKDLLGNQNAICGGGRYNNLVETLDGPTTPAVGFAFGVERLIACLQAAEVINKDDSIHAYILTLGDRAKEAGLALMQRFRMGGLITNMDFLDKSMKAQFKQSDHQNAKVVLILGDDELNKGVVQIKDQRSKEEYTVEINKAYQFLVDHFTKKTVCEDCEDCDCEEGNE